MPQIFFTQKDIVSLMAATIYASTVSNSYTSNTALSESTDKAVQIYNKISDLRLNN